MKLEFAKGHGTENDFVIVPSTPDHVRLEADTVARLCHRRRGIGADGVLRVVHARDLLETGELSALPTDVHPDDWFMDYRNADGSIAEMCGNGIRVFAHWLVTHEGVTESSIRIGTRAGMRRVTVLEANPTKATVTVDMGPVEVTGISTAQVGTMTFAGLAIDVGNPHLVGIIPTLTREALRELDMSKVSVDKQFFAHGTNVEVATPLCDGEVSMRVNERGVGETRSCGTGTVAVAKAALADAGLVEGTVAVYPPGGRVDVEITEKGARLTSTSHLVACGTMSV